MGGSLKQQKWLGVLGIVLLFSALFVVAAFLSALGSAPGFGTVTWKGIAELAAVIASLGALYGSVAALDRRSGIALGEHRPWRVTLSAAFGAATGLALGSLGEGEATFVWPLAGAGIGAILGWFGWRWARYVDF